MQSMPEKSTVKCTVAYCKTVNILNPKSEVCFEWI